MHILRIVTKVARERARLIDQNIRKSESVRLSSEKLENFEKDKWSQDHSLSDFSKFEKSWKRIDYAMDSLKFDEEQKAEVSR